jgi:hypothetical protein
MKHHRLAAALLAVTMIAGCATSATSGGATYSGFSTRSSSARADFMKSNPCPSTGKSSGACPGFAVDHKRPLAAGGNDHKSNMQWLSNSEHKAKTRAERKSCVYGCGKKRR